MSIQVTEGEQVHYGQSLITVMPENAELAAELFMPTRSAGFVVAGQEVRLRLDAFPHERYGALRGVVTQVDEVLLPQQQPVPIPIAEPVYRLQTRLADQVLVHAGKPLKLRPGMLLQADLMLDRRSILAWLVEPLTAVRHRL